MPKDHKSLAEEADALSNPRPAHVALLERHFVMLF
jgi:hypothetical protein